MRLAVNARHERVRMRLRERYGGTRPGGSDEMAAGVIGANILPTVERPLASSVLPATRLRRCAQHCGQVESSGVLV
jgi:hypothetical protein